MTRPQIIRADTIDLQDQTSPSAQDHSLQPSQPSPLGTGPPAPHQAASVHQVEEERQEETDRLAEAWHVTDTLQDESQQDNAQAASNAANGEHLYQRDEQAIQQNGGQSGHEDAEMAESETEAEDDMIDKISSSPSIDDGGLPSIPRWPQRTSSLTPSSTPTLSSPLLQDSPAYNSSSPFTSPPQHFPLCHSTDNTRQLDSPDDTSSPFNTPPQHFPLSPSIRKEHFAPSRVYHHNLRGEYDWTRNDDDDEDDEFGDLEDSLDDISDPTADKVSIESGSPLSKRRRPDSPPLKVAFARASSAASAKSGTKDTTQFQDEGFVDDLESILLPTNDPLLAAITGDEPTSPNGSSSSWISDDEGSSFDGETANDDDNAFLFSDDERFIDSGWGGECLRESEDIDFEFVYALHTFVATVEGQANATKGDTMVLLDDSNSYWWLVRIVKDSSIGYLPAEHIETPTERLARLNKHRNIDLSATMLGDNPEKSKNPLKKAMRRRNAKTVTFTAPTYVEPADYGDFTDEEENAEAELLANELKNSTNGQDVTESDANDETEKDETAVVEPLKVNGANKAATPESTERASLGDEIAPESTDDNSPKPRTSDEILSPPDGSRGKSRNGTVRNTDSFFKDENAETRKITLTPNLLRDDSSSSLRSIDAKESNIGDKLEKSVPPSERPKDERKRKDKKPGMLSGLFKSKKKDKKGRLVDEDEEKDILESSRVSSPSVQDASPNEKSPSPGQQNPSRQLSKGKLQKAPPSSNSPQSRVKSPVEEPRSTAAPTNLDDKVTSPPSTMRLVQPESEPARPDESITDRKMSADSQASEQHLDVGPGKEKGGKLSPITNLMRPSEPRPEKVKKAKQRVELDDFDSSPDDVDTSNPFDDSNENLAGRTPSEDSENNKQSLESTEGPSSMDSADQRTPPLSTESSSLEEQHSPVSPITAHRSPTEDVHQPASTSSSTPTMASPDPAFRSLATTHNNDLSFSRTRSPPQGQQAPNHAARSSPSSRNTDTPPTPSSQPTASTPTSSSAWSGAALHAYMAAGGDNSDVRDLLLVVRGSGGTGVGADVVPVSRDHPLMRDLYVEERKELQALGSQLDGLLGKWMARKGMGGLVGGKEGRKIGRA
ncbi:MAG: hypothetical protein M1821_000152 [Bathelium mastoideum]|nr:MAG: hypothetical protein M1821_000152 [Bathelium mastoideum]KAI9687816.1 MAG: hypothetical protein M1822_001896 [Bathelium mastoideum]